MTITDTASIDWNDLSAKLREPFDPREVDFRVQGKVNEQTSKAQVVAYIDARTVQDRLDAVVGAGNWSFDWQPLNLDGKGDVTTAKGIVTIHGVSKADIGTASNFEPSKGCVSDCFKRAAGHWGIGRYLYSIPAAWVPAEKGGRISENVIQQLRARLPRPAGLTALATTPATPAPSVTTPAPAQQRPQSQQAQRPAAATTRAASPFNPLQDVEFRRRAGALGYGTVAAIEQLTGGNKERAACFAALIAAEEQAAARSAS